MSRSYSMIENITIVTVMTGEAITMTTLTMIVMIIVMKEMIITGVVIK